MLTTYLNALPYTKFVLIEDCVAAKGGDLLHFLLRSHEKRQNYVTHFFVFERGFKRVRNKHPGSLCYDFTSDSRNWMQTSADLTTVVSNLNDNCIVVVDSLVHLLYRYGILEGYKILTELKNKNNVQQIITVLHTDVLEDKDKVVKYFEHLATLYLELETNRVSYTYKKSQRKIIRQVEQYKFDNGNFITEPIKKPDKIVIQNTLQQIHPENISTFKIGLSEKDKESRKNLVLPYLPKERDNGNIQYTFDDIDDWDEEDPDDDLDI